MSSIEKESFLEISEPLKNFDEEECFELLKAFFNIEDNHLRNLIVADVWRIANASKKQRVH